MALLNWRMVLGLGISISVGVLLCITYEMSRIIKQCDIARELLAKININHSLLNDNQEIEAKYRALKDLVKQYPAYDLVSVMFHFYQEASLSGIALEIIKPNVAALKGNEAASVVKVSAVGSLSQLEFFLYRVVRARLPVSLRNFSLHWIDNNWRIILYFTVFVSPATELSVHTKVKDHFSLVELQGLFPLKQIRYAGFIGGHGLQWAMVKLPNEKMLFIQVGSMLGVEKANVTKITNQEIQLEDKQKRIYFLKM